MVACSQPLAAQAGIEILNKGGNAADAAVAVAAALAVIEPVSCGMGGDMFCLYWNEAEKSLKGINGSGRSPMKLDLKKARELNLYGREIPPHSAHAVTVPGAAAGFVDTVETFGSGKVTLSDVLQPGIRLAEDGFPVSEITSLAWRHYESLLLRQSPNGKEMLCENGKAPEVGQFKRNPTLANTLRTLASEGKKGYYEGRIAQAIVNELKAKGGLMELSDLSSHVSECVDPISYTYKSSFTLHECPPNGQGLTPLIALGILEQMQELGLVGDLGELDHNGVEYCHAVIEALRLAFADTRAYIADMQHGYVPIEEMLSTEYLRKRAKLFDPTKATADVRRGSPLATSDTVYLTTSDKAGNACSFIFSNFAGVGTGIVPKECGFTLQNRGSGFTLEEGHPNVLAGGKRPYHTIIPAMVTKGQDLWMAYGVMGGFMQPQGHVQVLLNMLHRGFNPQNALDAPRLCISTKRPEPSASTPVSATATSTNGALEDGSISSGASSPSAINGWMGDIISEVYFEEGISEHVVQKLEQMGHKVALVKGDQRSLFGRGQIVQRVLDAPSGRKVWAAGSDPRGDGHAVPEI